MRLSTSCVVILLLHASFWFVLQSFRPLHDVDIFWQVRVGAMMWERGELIHDEPFAAMHATERFPPLSWLCQLLYAKIHAVGGWRLLHSVDAFVWLGGLSLAAAMVRREATAIGLGLAILMAYMASFPFASTRPQSWALPAFAALLWILRSDGRWPWKIVAATPLLLVWQNLHPSVSVAGIVVGALFLGELARRRFDAALFGIGIVCAVASVATPAGWTVFEVSAKNAELSRALGVDEWQSLWSPKNRQTGIVTWLAMAMTVFLWVRRSGTPSRRDWIPAAVLTVMTLLSFRFVVFWSVAMIPVWTVLLGRSTPSPAPAPRWRSVIVGAAFAFAALAPWWIRPDVLSDTLPLRSVETLRETGIRGVVYNDAPWGGPLIFAGDDRWKVTADGRYYVYTADEWNDYLRAVRGQTDVAELVAKFRPAAFFLHPGRNAGLVEKLDHHPEWERLESGDANAVIFVLR